MWFRVNELLPLELQKDLPDGSPSGSAFESHTAIDAGFLKNLLSLWRNLATMILIAVIFLIHWSK